MKLIVRRVLLIAASVAIICGTYVATSRASCGPNCNYNAPGFVKITSCFAVHNTTGCKDFPPNNWCQNDFCVYVAGLPRNPHIVGAWGSMCISDQLRCANGGPHACTDKPGPN